MNAAADAPADAAGLAALDGLAGDDALLDRVQHDAFSYFVRHGGGDNGLVPDATRPGSPCSISAVGLALSCYPVGVERGWMTRAEALRRTLAALRFFRDSDMCGSAEATGYSGFYYHFLDMDSGRRAGRASCRSSTPPSSLAGMRTAALWFDGDDAGEREVREIAEALCGRVDWRWMQHGEGAVCTAGSPAAASCTRAGWLQRSAAALRAGRWVADPDAATPAA